MGSEGGATRIHVELCRQCGAAPRIKLVGGVYSTECPSGCSSHPVLTWTVDDAIEKWNAQERERGPRVDSPVLQLSLF